MNQIAGEASDKLIDFGQRTTEQLPIQEIQDQYGPFFTKTAQQLTDEQMRYIANINNDPQSMVLDIMKHTGLLDTGNPESAAQAKISIAETEKFYRNNFFIEDENHKPIKDTDAVMILFDDTERYEDIPLLKESIRLWDQHRSNDKVVEAQHIVRLLVHDEINRLSSSQAMPKSA
jgi:hypothetical protein